jgi:hypothetical protein
MSDCLFKFCRQTPSSSATSAKSTLKCKRSFALDEYLSSGALREKKELRGKPNLAIAKRRDWIPEDRMMGLQCSNEIM